MSDIKSTVNSSSVSRHMLVNLHKMCLAQEDINFSINGVRLFIETPEDVEAKINARDIKEYLFHASIVSHCKPFIGARGEKLGALKIKHLPTLKVPECRLIHEELISVRNKCVAHNDDIATTSFITWDEKAGIHFPQRARKKYWTIREAQEVWALMKCLERDILNYIYANLREMKVKPGRSYLLDNGDILEFPDIAMPLD